jgi:hypothetical protein
VVVFVFYDSAPLTGFQLKLLDPHFDERLSLVGDFELLTSRDDLSPVSIRTHVFPLPAEVTDFAKLVFEIRPSAVR